VTAAKTKPMTTREGRLKGEENGMEVGTTFSSWEVNLTMLGEQMHCLSLSLHSCISKLYRGMHNVGMLMTWQGS